MTYTKLPSFLVSRFPGATIELLARDSSGVFYHYSLPGYGIVDGYGPEGFYYYDPENKFKKTCLED